MHIFAVIFLGYPIHVSSNSSPFNVLLVYFYLLLYGLVLAHSLTTTFNLYFPCTLAFTPLTEVVQSLSPTQKSRWDRLYMVSDRKGSYAHPLIYNHPVTGKEVSR